MAMVNMLEAKSSLSRLVEVIEQGREREIILARNGRPAARLVPVAAAPIEQRILHRAASSGSGLSSSGQHAAHEGHLGDLHERVRRFSST